MRMADIIEHKKQGLALTKEEIEFFVKEYTNGDIPDYQASALAMAIYFNKMTNEETAALTLAMAKSGDMLDLSGLSEKFSNVTCDCGSGRLYCCKNERQRLRLHGRHD